jgi:hypothetical protein
LLVLFVHRSLNNSGIQVQYSYVWFCFLCLYNLCPWMRQWSQNVSEKIRERNNFRNKQFSSFKLHVPLGVVFWNFLPSWSTLPRTWISHSLIIVFLIKLALGVLQCLCSRNLCAVD